MQISLPGLTINIVLHSGWNDEFQQKFHQNSSEISAQLITLAGDSAPDPRQENFDNFGRNSVKFPATHSAKIPPLNLAEFNDR